MLALPSLTHNLNYSALRDLLDLKHDVSPSVNKICSCKGLLVYAALNVFHELVTREYSAVLRLDLYEQDARLFAVLVGRRAHLRPIVVVALQTGMRQGEILGLRWEHVVIL